MANRDCRGANSIDAHTVAASRIEPKPPAFCGSPGMRQQGHLQSPAWMIYPGNAGNFSLGWEALLWLAVPIYLMWMQRCVYGGDKALTVLRYLTIGGVHPFLVSFVVMYAVLAGISA